jgi:subtilisin
VKHVTTALCLLLSSAAAFAQDSTVRVIVSLQADGDASVVADQGGSVVKALKNGRALVAHIAPSKVAALRAAKGVTSVEEDIECSVVGNGPSAEGKPAPSAPAPQPLQEVPWGIARIGAPAAWTTSTGADVLVGVSDTGIDTNHPDLAANYVGGWNSINETSLPEDDNGHGTHVSGTIAGVQNSIGVVGVAPGAKIYAAKGLNRRGSGWASDLGDGIDLCRLAGVKVISMSWGSSAESSYIADAIGRAISADIVCVAAAGNEGADQPGYPAATANVLSVGATDSLDVVPTWSNRNPDISAPGVSVKSTWKGDTYNTISGTSMATPHVSGVVALVRATNPSLNRAEAEGKLTSTATDKGNSTLYGVGIVNAAAAASAAAH